jgi:hypothetical protein
MKIKLICFSSEQRISFKSFVRTESSRDSDKRVCVYILVVYALETILRNNKFLSRRNIEDNEDPIPFPSDPCST